MTVYRRNQRKRVGRITSGSPTIFPPKKQVVTKQPVIVDAPVKVTPIIKLDISNNIELSVALPCYRANKIAWLALESLCRQKGLTFNWELIVCEEEHEEMIGGVYLNEYIERLISARCTRVVYLHLDRWVNLAEKWKIMGQHIDASSESFVLQAADCYAPSERLSITYDLINRKGYDWIDFNKGYFYNFNYKQMILYDPQSYDKNTSTNLHMAFKSIYAKELQSTNKVRGIDGYLFNTIRAIKRNVKKYSCDKLLTDGIDTDGFNTISKARSNYYKKTDFPFVPCEETIHGIGLPDDIVTRIQTNGVAIRQIRFSKSVRFFSNKMLQKYGLKEYINKGEPAVFMGLYGPGDYDALKAHKADCVILWCGSDSMNIHKYIDKYNITLLQHHHIAIGEFISNDLKVHGIKHELIPINPSSVDIKPCKQGDSVYMYSSERNPKFYGENLVPFIKAKTGLNVIVAYKDSYTYEELMDVYKDCFIGLRLTKHDGLPNTVIELGLMGRKCIYNGNLPNSIPWNNIDDICENLMKEFENRKTANIKAIHSDMKNYLDVSNDWLNINYHRKPKVSVVMNSYNEKPEYFLEAVQSYLNQKDVRVELIVSTVKGDPCIKVCKKYPIKLVINETPGIYSQLNAGMKMVTGDWVVYASSNDKALDTKLIYEVNMCIDNKKEVCYSAFNKCDDELNVKSAMSFPKYDYKEHLKGNFVSDCALFSRRLLDKYMPFKEEYGNFAYHSFWLRIYEGEGDVFVYNDSPTWMYRIGNKSRHISKQNDKELLSLEKMQKQEMLKAHQLMEVI